MLRNTGMQRRKMP